MISYFRSILPSRLVLLILLYLLIQLPLILLGIPATQQELLHMLVGERMANGFSMYRDIYDNTAPLSAMVYWLIDLMVGRSFVTFRVTAMVLVLLQALFLNLTFNRLSVYASKTYLPALLYLIIGSITFEFNMLTPLLIGNTFVVLSLPYIVTVSREGFENNRLFVGGFMLGLAALSYLPLSLFLLVGVFAVILFASSSFRSFLLMLCGFAFPYAVLVTYYFYIGSVDEFLEMHLLRAWRFYIDFLISPADLAKLLAVPMLVLFLSLMSTFSLPQRLVFQVKFQQVMWVWLLTSLIVIFSRPVISAGIFLLLLPPIAYFSEFFFSTGKKKWMMNLLFVTVLTAVVLLRYKQPLGLNQLVQINESKLILPQKPSPRVTNATVVVLGDDISFYEHNLPVTPYLNWQLAQRHFGELNEYMAVYEVYQNFKKETPAYIVDKAGLMPELIYKVPAVFGLYEPTETDGIYKLK
ncbi:hypothetical protein ACFSKU_16980 [Pontibacter silvestris]|uniref:Glycosyltransferase RgtA/B/C/D-like domain-containing protein n=1 Tax=Pontibacter silvestris TaxID=2305183 RepID=A0ABW4X2J5_9BACT|nr:hypothetical protein [Pontibacter silvestris]MCC9135718.1 hypothetical protein [Pontibacter silvestris]